MSSPRFKVQPDEQVLFKGPLTYHKSKWGLVSCEGVLTNRRLALGKKLNPMYSVIPRLYVWIRGKKVVFEIPLEQIGSIHFNDEKTRGSFVIKTTDGAEYRVSSYTLLKKKNEDWISAISDAMSSTKQFVPMRTGDTSIEFQRA